MSRMVAQSLVKGHVSWDQSERGRARELCEVVQWKRGLSVPLLKDGIGVRWSNLST